MVSATKNKNDNSYVEGCKVYIYLRCSTETQSVDTHEDQIKKYCEMNSLPYLDENVYKDHAISGNKPWKQRKINDIITKATKGDHLVVSELSRLSRNARDIYNIIEICKEKGINVHCIKEGYKNDGSMTSVILLGTLSTMAQLEREFAVTRAKSAVETKKANGVTLGRGLYCDLDVIKSDIEKDIVANIPLDQIAKKYDVSKTKLYQYCNRRQMLDVKKHSIPFLVLPERKSNRNSPLDKHIDQINEDLKTMKVKDIAEKMNVNHKTLQSYIVKNRVR